MTTAPSGGESAPLMLRAAARAVALDRDLTHTALRVLKYAESILGYKLHSGIAQKTVAQELGISAAEVPAALRHCVSRGSSSKRATQISRPSFVSIPVTERGRSRLSPSRNQSPR